MSKLRNLALLLGLAIFAVSAMGQTNLKTLIIQASEDAYVVTDLASEEDPQNLRGTNYGSLEFLKAWYAWGVIDEEKLLSVNMVKFDLTELKDVEIESVVLQLFARQADLTESARLVDINLIQTPWSEGQVTFDTRPNWDRSPVATAAIYGAGGWYSWNVSGTASAGARRGEVSYSILLRNVSEENEEQVLFVSREGGERGPRLLVTYTPGPENAIMAIDWWWWVAVGAGVVALMAAAYVLGHRGPKLPPKAAEAPSVDP